jgi:hypothetical protein
MTIQSREVETNVMVKKLRYDEKRVARPYQRTGYLLCNSNDPALVMLDNIYQQVSVDQRG